MRGRRVLIIGGSSAENIDDMRIVTNRGTGETAVELAKAAYHEGADVELWMGRCTVPLPSFVPIRRFESLADLEPMISDIDHDMVVVPAALSDFTFDKKGGKLPSEAKVTKLQLKSVPKMLPLIVKQCDRVVGFKAESGIKKEELVKEAIESLNRNFLSAVVANDLKDVTAGRTKVIFVRARYQAEIEGTKSEVAHQLMKELVGI
jgi:phosphopantothenoylcysteine decarboxylase/phosphopantothenate--cysteine ligase